MDVSVAAEGAENGRAAGPEQSWAVQDAERRRPETSVI